MKKNLKFSLLMGLLIVPYFLSAQEAIPPDHVRGYRNNGALQQSISTLPAKTTEDITMPVLLGVKIKDITPNFGDSRDGGVRTHEGEDIMSAKGTPIVSPTPAVVIRVGTGPSEGNYVYTANPGGETFVYMHLDTLSPLTLGTVLQTGSLIGFVGNTGNASLGATHLHFEVHNSSGVAVDPFLRLKLEFTSQEKSVFLANIFNVTSDKNLLAETLITGQKKELEFIRTQGISLPAQILNLLSSSPTNVTRTESKINPNISSVPMPVGSNVINRNLTLGLKGEDVRSLQAFIIRENKGSNAKSLAAVGTTGYFGGLTQKALAEFQASVGILPSLGYFGTITRAYLASI